MNGQTQVPEVLTSPEASRSPEVSEAYIVTTPLGFTESFDAQTIKTLVALGLIEFESDAHLLEDGRGNGLGPLYHFYLQRLTR